MAKKYWKSQGILSVQKSGNPVRVQVFFKLHPKEVSDTFDIFIFSTQVRGMATLKDSE